MKMKHVSLAALMALGMSMSVQAGWSFGFSAEQEVKAPCGVDKKLGASVSVEVEADCDVPCDIDCDKEGEQKEKHGTWGAWKRPALPSFSMKCEPVGAVKGVVFVDTNENGKLDMCSDERLANVGIKVIDKDGKVHTAKTMPGGLFTVSGLPAGEVTVDIDESTLPEGAELVVGQDMKKVTVKAGCITSAGDFGYNKGTEASGDVFGFVFEDRNMNGLIDPCEKMGMDGIEVELVDSEGNAHRTTTDMTGKYYFANIPEGTATVTVVSAPSNAFFVIGENPSDVDVHGGKNFAGIDGYITCGKESGGTVTGFVFEDRDSNGEYNEEYDVPIANLTVSIDASDGNEYNVTTDDNGYYKAENIPAGDANVTVDTDALVADHPKAVQTAGENPTEITVEEGQVTDAGTDAFNYKEGAVFTGLLFKDDNENGELDDEDSGIENVTVTLWDQRNDEIHVETTTDAQGVWYAYVKDRNNARIIIEADEDEIKERYGDDMKCVVGRNPVKYRLKVGKLISVNSMGFGVKEDDSK